MTEIDSTPDPRQLRGKAIAASLKITRTRKGQWLVPAQSKSGAYRVSLMYQTCTCPDWQERQLPCKHLWAVRYTEHTVTRSQDTTETVEQTVSVTYTRDWAAYNGAQCEEKRRFVELLADLCRDVPQPVQAMGRPRLPMGDMAFSAVFKVYSGFSARRFTTDLEDALAEGLITRAPHFNSVLGYLSDPAMTPVLRELIATSALPLTAVEHDFAVDSSGFATTRFVRWFDAKYGPERDFHDWVKCHMAVGVLTKVVTAVEISGRNDHDTKYFPTLVAETARRFDVAEVSADKAYLSHTNLDAVVRHGAVPFIPFKSTTVVPRKDSVWTRMYHWASLNREQWLRHYHQRSNVESAFHMIKSKFGDSLRSKGDVAQENEVLAKVLCHNLVVLIHAARSLGIETAFRPVNREPRPEPMFWSPERQIAARTVSRAVAQEVLVF